VNFHLSEPPAPPQRGHLSSSFHVWRDSRRRRASLRRVSSLRTSVICSHVISLRVISAPITFRITASSERTRASSAAATSPPFTRSRRTFSRKVASSSVFCFCSSAKTSALVHLLPYRFGAEDVAAVVKAFASLDADGADRARAAISVPHYLSSFTKSSSQLVTYPISLRSWSISLRRVGRNFD